MSDLAIPGVGSSKYGSDKLIEGLMKLERVPRDKAAEQLETYKKQKTVWLELSQRLSSVRDDARGLFSFKNPFTERVATSSDEEVLAATATREALEQNRRIEVKQVAQADRYLSADLPKDTKVKAGDYSFTVGDKSLELRFGGGSLQDFAEALTRKGRDLLRASVVSVRPDTQALVVESLKTGHKNRLGFQNDAETLAVDLGIMERVRTKAQDFSPASPLAWNAPLDSSTVRFESGALTLQTGAEAKLALPSPTKTKGLVLEIEYRLLPLPDAATATPPPGPSIGVSGSASFEGITINGAPSESALPAWTPPPTPPRVDDRNMAFLVGAGGQTVALPALEDATEPKKITIELGDRISELDALGFRNRDTSHRLEIVSARVFDPEEQGGLKPVRPVSTAQDALVSLDGIEAIRETNEVSDLIPGVTLSLKEASDKPVRLKIEPDRKAVKDALISLVGDYNRLMAQINILSRNDERLIQEITYFTDEEKKSATERLGLFQGDSTLSMLRTSLQRIMMEPYTTEAGGDLTLLSQIGVATDARRPGSGQGYDVGKMRGYLEIEEDSLDAALAKNFESVKDLFGYDSDGDLIIDSGAAYSLDTILKPYVETGGILSLKTQTLDRQIGNEQRTIENLDKALALKEDELKRKYGMMEGTLNRLESTSSSLENFQKQNSGNQ